MKSWLLSIVIASILISVFSIILPRTRTGYFIKGIFHIMLFSIILRPILTNSYNIDNIFNFIYSDIEIQQDFIEEINVKKIDGIVSFCEKLLENNGVKDAEVQVLYAINVNQNLIIEKISVNLKNSVIISDDMNIDIIGRTKSLLASNLNIKEEMVEIYV